tara:strand:- start:1150 stop:1383 length:234 start_codon:yes stop_codon:yes gene_type:complete
MNNKKNKKKYYRYNMVDNKKHSILKLIIREHILNNYDIELQTLNNLLIKKQITKSEYNKSMKYNNKMLKIDLKKEGF